jgi:ribosomal protein S18 acetylase RimI-like enzyme
MIKEIFRQNFQFKKELVFPYKSTKYLDVVTNPDNMGNLVFEFKIKDFDKPFFGKIVRKLFNDYDQFTRFFSYVNQNDHESAFLSIGFQTIDIYKIWDIFVEPTFQNLRIGTELLKYAEKIAREWSAKVLVVECQSSNYPAINFFQKNNFLITGFNLVHKTLGDLKKHDFLVMMSKILI